MNRLFQKLLGLRCIEHLTLDENFIILESSSGVKRFADSLKEVKPGIDVRARFPELIGTETILSDIIQGKRESFELKEIVRYLDESTPLYFNLFVAQFNESDKTNDDPARLIILFEEVTEQRLVVESLIKKEKETIFLLDALGTAKSYIEKVINSTIDILIVTNSSGCIKTINKATQTLLGYKKEELIGQNISLIVGKNILCQVSQKVGYAGELFNDVEVICQTKTGEKIPVAFSASAIQADTEYLQDFVYIGREIAERKRAEEKLKESEERFRLLVEGIRDYAIFMLDPSGRVASWNAGAESIMGYRAEEILGEHISSFHTRDSIQRGLPVRELQIATTEGKYEEEGWRVRSDGTQFWANVVLTALRDSCGNLRGFSQLTRDITERKQAQEALEKSNQQIVNILESITDAFLAVDRQWEFTYINQQAAKLLQKSREELLGKNIWDEFPNGSDSKFCNEYRRSLEREIPVAFEEFYAPADAWLEVRAYPSKDGLSVYLRDISDRKLIEENRAQLLACEQEARAQAEASELRFRFLAESIPVQVWTAQPDGSVNYVNRRIQDYFGRTLEEMLGWEWQEWVHPEDLPRCLDRWSFSLETGEPYEVEFRLKQGADGSYRWHLGRALPLRIYSSRIVSWFGTNTDIDDRKRAEQELQESEAAIRALHKAISARKLNFDQRMQELLAMGRRYFGLEMGALGRIEGDRYEVVAVQLPVHATFKMSKGNSFNLAQTYCRETLGAKEPIAFECAGTSQWCTHLAYTASKLEAYIGMPVVVSGEVYGTLSFFSSAPRPKLFTDRDKELLKLMAQWVGGEIERQQAIEALRQQNLRSQLFAEITLKIRQSLQLEEILQVTVTEVRKLLQVDRVLILRVWPDGTGSEVVMEAVASDRPLLIGQTFSPEIFPVEYHPAYKQGRIQAIENVDNANIAPCHAEFLKHLGVQAKLVVPILQREELWGMLIAHQCASSRQWSFFEMELLQQLSNQVGIALDQAQFLEALQQSERETRKALAKEKELSELKSRFISMTSHEFRTPLATILAASDLLKRFGHKLSEEKKVERINKIQAEVKNMTRLLEDVLIIGKAEAGRIEFNPCCLFLEEFCRDIVEEIELTATSISGIEFSFRGEERQPELDEKLLRHILVNLLSNAVKYSPPGKRVRFEIFCDAERAIFKIQDEGIGIPAPDRDRLFEAFHRASNVGNIPGTGLGLAIVKNAVELHGGNIAVESEVGVGTTFIVCLPTKQIKDK